ncbi:hypothetical protein TRVA0_014S00452 [Trichomonascus vanleenenianus]|uniref:C2HC-type zinc finger protein n=1 Tax=Trichomonascus vanleenenianus TaxID=2268995 RepID=UPI003ECAC9E7
MACKSTPEFPRPDSDVQYYPLDIENLPQFNPLAIPVYDWWANASSVLNCMDGSDFKTGLKFLNKKFQSIAVKQVRERVSSILVEAECLADLDTLLFPVLRLYAFKLTGMYHLRKLDREFITLPRHLSVHLQAVYNVCQDYKAIFPAEALVSYSDVLGSVLDAYLTTMLAFVTHCPKYAIVIENRHKRVDFPSHIKCIEAFSRYLQESSATTLPDVLPGVDDTATYRDRIYTKTLPSTHLSGSMPVSPPNTKTSELITLPFIRFLLDQHAYVSSHSQHVLSDAVKQFYSRIQGSLVAPIVDSDKVCWFCGERGHVKSNCPTLLQYIAQEKLYIDDLGTLRYTIDGDLVKRPQKKNGTVIATKFFKDRVFSILAEMDSDVEFIM